MIAAGWSCNTVAQHVLTLLQAWMDVLEDVAREAETRFGSLGPLTAEELASLVGLAFLGGEALILLNDQQWSTRARTALRSVSGVIRAFEEA